MKACLKKTHTEIYGCNKGFDEWCHPDTNTAERVAYTQQKLASLRNRYMAQHPNALDPVEERKNLLAAQNTYAQQTRPQQERSNSETVDDFKPQSSHLKH